MSNNSAKKQTAKKKTTVDGSAPIDMTVGGESAGQQLESSEVIVENKEDIITIGDDSSANSAAEETPSDSTIDKPSKMSFSERICNLFSPHKKLKEQFTELQKTAQDLESHLSNTSSELETLQSSLKESKDENARLESQLNALKVEIDSKANALETLKGEKEELVQKNSSIQTNYKVVLKNYEDAKNNYENAKKNFEEATRKLNSAVDDGLNKDRQNAKLLNENNNLKKLLETSRLDIDKTKDALAKKNQDVEAARREVAEKKEELDKATQSRENWKKRYTDLLKENPDAAAVAKLELENSKLEEQIKDLAKRKEQDIAEAIAEATSKIEELEDKAKKVESETRQAVDNDWLQKVETIKAETEKRIEELNSSANKTLADFKVKATAELEETKKKAKEEHDDVIQKAKQRVDQIKTEAEKKIAESEKKLAESKEANEKKILKLKEDADARLKSELEAADAKLVAERKKAQEQLEQASTKLEKTISAHRDEIGLIQAKHTAEITELNNKHVEEQKDLNNKLEAASTRADNIFDTHTALLKTIFEGIRSDIKAAYPDGKGGIVGKLIESIVSENDMMTLSEYDEDYFSPIFEMTDIKSSESLEEKMRETYRDLLTPKRPTWLDALMRLDAMVKVNFIATQFNAQGLDVRAIHRAADKVTLLLEANGIILDVPQIFEDTFDSSKHEAQPIKDISSQVEDAASHVTNPETIVDIFTIGYHSTDGKLFRRPAVSRINA